MQLRRKYKRAQRRFYMRSIFAQRKEHGYYHQLVRELELREYYPRYLCMTPYILEDILCRVGPLLQYGASISAMMICCNIDLPLMTGGRDNALMGSWILACDWIITSARRRLVAGVQTAADTPDTRLCEIVGGTRRSMNRSGFRRRKNVCRRLPAAEV